MKEGETLANISWHAEPAKHGARLFPQNRQFSSNCEEALQFMGTEQLKGVYLYMSLHSIHTKFTQDSHIFVLESNLKMCESWVTFV